MSDGTIIIDTKIDGNGAEKGVQSLSGKLGGLAKGALVGITATTVAVGGLVKASIEQFSQFEQLTGGVETLFKSSRNIVMDYADNAYKTAGMSANEYMSTITGFSASLLQGLGGDTAKAAEVGNTAVTDMSDNANKMGTSIENIQNSYQGFAKQNYTMLDNLKLGYGGTKTEMERLLVDAEKVSGIKYNIDNFSDVIKAIHIVQNEMGITGTTAKEASSTIEGSLKMTQSAWSNLLTNMAFDDADFDTLVGNLVDSAGALGENLLPRIEIALNGIGELINQLLPPIAEKVPEIIMSLLPKMVEAGTNVITSLITGIQTNLPVIATGAVEIASTLMTALLTMLPQLLDMGMQLIVNLALGIALALPTLIPAVVQTIMQLVTTLFENLPLIINAGIQILQGLVQGILQALPMLIAMLPQLINSILTYLTTSLPVILQAGMTILLALINGLVEALPQLIAMLPQIINSVISVLTNNLPMIISMGITVLIALINGLVQALPQLIGMLPTIINTIITVITNNLPAIINAGVQILIAIAGGLIQAIPTLIGAIPTIIGSIISAFFNVNWGEIGLNIIGGIGAGIISGIGSVIDSAKNACSNIKDSITGFFGIHSPSRLMKNLVGVNIVKGIGVGIDLETPNLDKDINSNMSDLVARMKGTVDFETARTTASVVAQNNFSIAKDNPNMDTTSTSNNKTTIEIPVVLDGMKIAMVTAPYMDTQLNNISTNKERGGS